jgi:hypothetical protein
VQQLYKLRGQHDFLVGDRVLDGRGRGRRYR